MGSRISAVCYTLESVPRSKSVVMTQDDRRTPRNAASRPTFEIRKMALPLQPSGWSQRDRTIESSALDHFAASAAARRSLSENGECTTRCSHLLAAFVGSSL